VIEVVSAARCVECNLCVRVCPADVFDAVPDGAPVIARQAACQTCFLCELYCPVDALFVDPNGDGPASVREADIEAAGLFGSYARAMGWQRGKPGGADRDPTFHIRAAMGQ
jgi:NAD-dependent dihydropyrimidine dehydrogenase PreA subunit